MWKEIKKMWDTHHTSRKLIKMFVTMNVGFVVTNYAILTQNVPVEYQAFVSLVGALIVALHNYLKHNTTGVPLVSKDNKKKR